MRKTFRDALIIGFIITIVGFLSHTMRTPTHSSVEFYTNLTSFQSVIGGLYVFPAIYLSYYALLGSFSSIIIEFVSVVLFWWILFLMVLSLMRAIRKRFSRTT